MLDGKTPAALQNLQNKAQLFAYLSLIFIFSLINFFSSKSSRFLILSKNSITSISPIFLNVFVEDEIYMLVINIILSFAFVKLMLRYWTLSYITLYTYPIAIFSNFLSFLVISIFTSGIDIHGSLSLNVSLSCLLCYLARGEKQNIINRFSIYPSEIFYFIIFWTILCLRWPPVIALSSIISIIITYSVLFYFKPGNEYTRNENFTWRSLITTPHDDRDGHSPKNALLDQNDDTPRIPSILNSFENDGNQTLSEAEQNRRLRALRAIEERLATANRH